MIPLFVNMPRRSRSRPRRRAFEKRQRLLVNGIGSDATIESRDRFGVVVEDVRLSVEHRVECGFVAIEVGNQDLDLAFRIQCAHLANGFGPVRSATVRQIVTID
jgi:hypothetical protein